MTDEQWSWHLATWQDGRLALDMSGSGHGMTRRGATIGGALALRAGAGDAVVIARNGVPVQTIHAETVRAAWERIEVAA